MAGGTRSTKGGGRTTASRSTRTGADARQRTAARRAAQSKPPGARRSRTTTVAAVVLLGVLVLGIVGTLALTRDDGDDSVSADDATAPVTGALTGTVLTEQGSVLPISTVPATYELTYRVETSSAGASIVRTEAITVRRPFDARLVAFTVEASFDEPEVDARSNLGLYGDVTDPDDPDVGEGMPAAALGDVRFDGALFDLVDARVFVPRERREVLGRECQVYRTGSLVESPPLTVPTAATYADVCIDAAGLVLEEVSIVDGVAETYEIATAIEIDPVLDDATFAITGEPISLEDGGNDLVPLDTTVAPVASYWEPSSAPLGATHVGRYMLRTPIPSASTTDTSTTAGPNDPTGQSIDTYVDVYATGSTFVIVHQGVLSDVTARDTTLGKDVDAGALGAARVAFGATGSTLVATSGTWFVEVNAPLPASELAAVAATFAPSSATG